MIDLNGIQGIKEFLALFIESVAIKSRIRINGGECMHGRGFESLILGVNGSECMVEGSNLGLFGGQLWCNHPQNQQSQPNPTQSIEATWLVYFKSVQMLLLLNCATSTISVLFHTSIS
jgi:hypothetical protein